jgi:hypothetical protein
MLNCPKRLEVGFDVHPVHADEATAQVVKVVVGGDKGSGGGMGSGGDL